MSEKKVRWELVDEIDSEKIQNSYNQIVKTTDKIKKMTEEFYKEEFWQKIFKIVDDYKKLDFSKSIFSTSRMIALYKLSNLKWPFFLYLDEKTVKLINSCSESETSQIVIYNFSHDTICKIKDKWFNYTYLTTGEKALLKEAITLYEEHRYSACVSILMCQFSGINQRLTDVIKEKKINIDENEIFSLYQKYYPESKNNIKDIAKKKSKVLNCEKGKLILARSVMDKGIYFSGVCFDYIINTVLTSKETYDINQPCRNKICHGIQTDINSEELAVKSILTIDMIITFGEYIIKI